MSSRDRLLSALRTVDRGGDVVSASSTTVRELIQSFKVGLSRDEVSLLTDPEGAAAGVRPLTHLVLGGSSPAAYFAIATGDLAELVVAGRGRITPVELVAAARELKARAAASFLRERAIDVGSERGPTAVLCDEIDRAAAVLGRRDVRRLVRVVAAELDDTPKRQLAIAEAATWDLDAKGARAAFARARVLRSEPQSTIEYRRRVEDMIHAVDVVRAAANEQLSRGRAIEVARAQLLLGRTAAAESTVAPYAARASSHLALATTLARAEIGGTICPGFPGGAGSALCAAAWRSSAKVKRVLPILEKAWRSQKGRDREAIETYIGLAHVVPAMYGALGRSDVSREAAARSFVERVRALGAVAREVQGVAPSFEALALFTDSLLAAVVASASPAAGGSPRVPEAQADALYQRAAEVVRKAPHDGIAQASLLAVACMFSQRRDGLALLRELPENLEGANRLPRATALLWESVSRDRGEIAERGRAELLALAPSLRDLERAGVVLLIAEVDAARTNTPAQYELLRRVASKLTSPTTPLDLRLRAVIDLAGAAARSGDRGGAIDILERTLGGLAGDPSAESSSLFVLAKAYRIVLRARAAPLAERLDLRRRLDELFDRGSAGPVPESVRLWRDLWASELEFSVRAERCSVNKICVAGAKKVRAESRANIDERIGAEAGRILRKGSLAAGSVSLSFQFSDSGRLQPVVSFRPRILAIEVPALE